MKGRKDTSIGQRLISSKITPSLAISFTFSVFFLMSSALAYPASTQINFILDLVDGKGVSISDATCTGYIWNNDMVTINQTLSLSYSTQSKVYYAQFTTPDSAGQYLQSATCNLTSGKTVYDRKAFSVESYANIDEKLTSINNTVKNVNNTIMNKLYGIQDEITSVNNTVKTETQYWGNLVDTDVNYQGDRIWNFLQNITFGGNVTANVDYDEIALRVIMYMKGFKVWNWWPTSFIQIG